MALLSSQGISTPSLPAQGEQRRLILFQHTSGHPLVVSQRAIERIYPYLKDDTEVIVNSPPGEGHLEDQELASSGDHRGRDRDGAN
jgi:hypothetical protein